MSIPKELHDFGISDSHCFLCGEEVEGITREHVLPKWLLNKYDLWNSQLTLINNTQIPYRQLTVPCCAACNNHHLSKLETRIQNAVEGGYEAAVQLDTYDWYLWAAKVTFGFWRKECSIPFDRSAPSKGTILNEEALRSYSVMHMSLQSIIGKHQYTGDMPFSVLVCNLHDYGHHDFDLRNKFLNHTFMIRLGEIGVIVSFEDGGVVKDSIGRYVEDVDGHPLHPVQFEELFAKVNYQTFLIDKPLTYLYFHNKESGIRQSTLVPNVYVNQWENKDFAEFLDVEISRHWFGDYLDSVSTFFVPPDLVYTWMLTEEGEPLLQGKDEWMA